MRYLFAALISLPTLAYSQDFGARLDADLNDDGIQDFAVLTQYGDINSASLILYILRADGSQEYSVVAPDLVWVGGIGQEPKLRITEYGSLQVISMNESIGRNRWHEYLTIAYRQGTHKIVGYTYNWNDTLDLDAQGVCDINLLNGKANITIGGADIVTVTHSLRAVPIADWVPGIPRICVDVMN